MIHYNDHFIFKIMRLYVGSGFLVSHPGFHKPRHFYNLSLLGTMSDHNWQVFHLRGDLSLLGDTRHIFSLSFSLTVRLCWTLSNLTESSQSNTKRNIDLSIMYSHPFHGMSPCIFNAICHCMLYHVICLMNATWTT